MNRDFVGILSVLFGCSFAPAAIAQPTARFEDVAAKSPRSEPPHPPPTAEAPPSVPRSAPKSTPLGSNAERGGHESWATTRARQFVTIALEYEARGELTRAMAAYMDAIRMDPSFGPAYVGLGRLRELVSDFTEAERLYTTAARFANPADALTRRAHLRRRAGRDQEAIADLRALLELDPSSHDLARELARWYVERRAFPAALAIYRKLAADLEAGGNDKELLDARLQVRALVVLCAETDPVTSGGGAHPSWVRRSLATVARRTAR